jgi:hypothetical protein
MVLCAVDPLHSCCFHPAAGLPLAVAGHCFEQAPRQRNGQQNAPFIPQTLKSVSAAASCSVDAARLAPLYPEQLMVGMEIRDKVAAYVRERIGGPQAVHSLV